MRFKLAEGPNWYGIAKSLRLMEEKSSTTLEACRFRPKCTNPKQKPCLWQFRLHIFKYEPNKQDSWNFEAMCETNYPEEDFSPLLKPEFAYWYYCEGQYNHETREGWIEIYVE